MNGGLSQRARMLHDAHARHHHGLEAFNRACHGDPLREMQLAPAEDLQADDDAPIGDAAGLIKSLGWPRLLKAAAFAIIVWTATTAFAVTCGAPS